MADHLLYQNTSIFDDLFFKNLGDQNPQYYQLLEHYSRHPFIISFFKDTISQFQSCIYVMNIFKMKNQRIKARSSMSMFWLFESRYPSVNDVVYFNYCDGKPIKDEKINRSIKDIATIDDINLMGQVRIWFGTFLHIFLTYGEVWMTLAIAWNHDIQDIFMFPDFSYKEEKREAEFFTFDEAYAELIRRSRDNIKNNGYVYIGTSINICRDHPHQDSGDLSSRLKRKRNTADDFLNHTTSSYGYTYSRVGNCIEILQKVERIDEAIARGITRVSIGQQILAKSTPERVGGLVDVSSRSSNRRNGGSGIDFVPKHAVNGIAVANVVNKTPNINYSKTDVWNTPTPIITLSEDFRDCTHTTPIPDKGMDFLEELKKRILSTLLGTPALLFATGMGSLFANENNGEREQTAQTVSAFVHVVMLPLFNGFLKRYFGLVHEVTGGDIDDSWFGVPEFLTPTQIPIEMKCVFGIGLTPTENLLLLKVQDQKKLELEERKLDIEEKKVDCDLEKSRIASKTQLEVVDIQCKSAASIAKSKMNSSSNARGPPTK